MCVKLLTAAWETGLRPSAMLVLVFLADSASPYNDNTCWPSVARIARKTGLSIRTVQYRIYDLVDQGHISLKKRSGRSTKYLVHPRSDCTGANTAGAQQRESGGAKQGENLRKGCTQTIKNNKKEPRHSDQKPERRCSVQWSDPPSNHPETETGFERPVTILPGDFFVRRPQ
jgi:hypothetical protein